MATPFSAHRAMIDALDQRAIAYANALVEHAQAVASGNADEIESAYRDLLAMHEMLNAAAREVAQG